MNVSNRRVEGFFISSDNVSLDFGVLVLVDMLLARSLVGVQRERVPCRQRCILRGAQNNECNIAEKAVGLNSVMNWVFILPFARETI